MRCYNYLSYTVTWMKLNNGFKSQIRALQTTNKSKLEVDENSQRNALEQLGRETFGVKELDDWYAVPASKVYDKLRFILYEYRSLFDALKTLYPQHNWDPLCFSRVPRGYLKDEKAQREALEKLGIEQLGVKELNDWYGVSAKKVFLELSFVPREYGSLYNALKTLYPHHNWNPQFFVVKPQGYWSDENTQRDALERLGRELFGVKELDDWYSVSAAKVYRELSFVKNEYGSLFDALKKLYPQHNWNPLRLSNVPQGFWSDESTRKDALQRLGEELGVKELDDWYSVSSDYVRRKLSFVHGSLFEVLKKFYPQHNWDPLRFTRIPKGCWSDENLRREALEKLGRERLGVKELDDWYSVPAKIVFHELGFIHKEYGSLFDALIKLYPHHDWDPVRVSRIPRKYWQQSSTVQHYYNMFTQWKQTQGIRTVRDWYQLPPQHLKLFKRVAKGIFGGNRRMFEEWFPEIVWQSQFTSQIELQTLLKHVIADSNVKHYMLSRKNAQ